MNTIVELKLTALEQSVLDALSKKPGVIVRRFEIAEAAQMREADSNVLEVIVSRLRRKLKDAGVPLVITTKRGIGYSVKSLQADAA